MWFDVKLFQLFENHFRFYMVFNNLHKYPINRQKHKKFVARLHVLMTPLIDYFVTGFEQ
jgi:hypothetical protein